MGDDESQNENQANPDLLDLSQLKALSFGPSWSEGKVSGGTSTPENRRDRREDPVGRGTAAPRRDRRPRFERKTTEGGSDSPGGGRGGAWRERRGDDRGAAGERGRGGPRGRDYATRAEPYRPVYEVRFYPDDVPFKALAKAIRASHRTFELFEIARLILEKPERFAVVVRPLDEEKAPTGDGDEPGSLYISVPDGLPFKTEGEAINHVFKEHCDRFFVREEVEVAPPSGNFQQVSRCGVTGELIGPPNYHRYQEFLKEHHASRLPRMPWDSFLARLKTEKSEEAVQEWLDRMKKQERFTLRERADGSAEPLVMESSESARLYLLTHRKAAVVKRSESARFSGTQIPQLPDGDLKRSVEYILEGQRRFPLETANHLRSRLRRLKFAIYKRGSKGVSYVCAVKRRFREPGQTFSESVQQLIDFIEQHPNIKAQELPLEFLGIELTQADSTVDSPPAQAESAEAVAEPASEEMAGAEHPADLSEPVSEPSPAPTEPADAEPMGESIVSDSPATPSDAEVASSVEGDVPAPADAEPAVTGDDAAIQHAAPPPAAPAPEAPRTPSIAPKTLTPEEKLLAILKRDLYWLVSEGYVIEYSDSRLFAPPPAEPPKPSEPKSFPNKSASASAPDEGVALDESTAKSEEVTPSAGTLGVENSTSGGEPSPDGSVARALYSGNEGEPSPDADTGQDRPATAAGDGDSIAEGSSMVGGAEADPGFSTPVSPEDPDSNSPDGGEPEPESRSEGGHPAPSDDPGAAPVIHPSSSEPSTGIDGEDSVGTGSVGDREGESPGERPAEGRSL